MSLKRCLLMLILCQIHLVQAANPETSPASYSWHIVKSFAHDTSRFTQGLALHNGILYESTGLFGKSMLFASPASNPESLLYINHLSGEIFGEGITVIEDSLYQLTWRNGLVLKHSLSLKTLATANVYEGEGWGLTTNGKDLIASDGSNRLRFLDPETLKVRRVLKVYGHGMSWQLLNELEYANGWILANIWRDHRIAVINSMTGEVSGVVDFSKLQLASHPGNKEDVMNGIAYDAETNLFFITGKRWPTLYIIKIELPRFK